MGLYQRLAAAQSRVVTLTARPEAISLRLWPGPMPGQVYRSYRAFTTQLIRRYEPDGVLPGTML
jgi:hypothetical protein